MQINDDHEIEVFDRAYGVSCWSTSMEETHDRREPAHRG